MAPAGLDHAHSGAFCVGFRRLLESCPMLACLLRVKPPHTTPRSSLRKSTGDAPAEVHRNAVRPLKPFGSHASICRITPAAAYSSVCVRTQLILDSILPSGSYGRQLGRRVLVQGSAAPDLWLCKGSRIACTGTPPILLLVSDGLLRWQPIVPQLRAFPHLDHHTPAQDHHPPKRHNVPLTQTISQLLASFCSPHCVVETRWLEKADRMPAADLLSTPTVNPKYLQARADLGVLGRTAAP
ncbi:hypothetical protein B0T16DRAFT_408615 [Cercophora newfieldiana]|uniref:Uncharacterized protein n=1 Tax=Cercophora newfieldiana TaxID=92897 RepID=A0AA39YAE2_9PEZI|nr:hypothetical protein B0T16DRAFT_408615 [Cercophora newfieldiana]